MKTGNTKNDFNIVKLFNDNKDMLLTLEEFYDRKYEIKSLTDIKNISIDAIAMSFTVKCFDDLIDNRCEFKKENRLHSQYKRYF